jgi:hypothetical protein
MLCATKLKRVAQAARRLLFLVGVFFWAGCDYHVDSIYLGRKEAKFLGHVSQGDLKAVTLYLDRGGNVNLQDEPGIDIGPCIMPSMPTSEGVASKWSSCCCKEAPMFMR